MRVNNGGVFLLGVLLCPALVQGATIHVPEDQPAIQAGIDAAASGDTVLVAFVNQLQTNVGPPPAAQPAVSLGQSHPNHCYASTTIHHSLPAAGSVALAVYDIQGRCIRSLFHGHREAGA